MNQNRFESIALRNALPRSAGAPRRRATTPLLSLALMIAFAVSLPAALTGCGGSETGASRPANVPADWNGRATLTVVWPSLTRHIPYAATNLRVSVVDGTTGDCIYGDDASCKGPAFLAFRPTAADGSPEPTTTQDLPALPVRRPLKLKMDAFGSKSDTSADPANTTVPVASGETLSDSLVIQQPYNPNDATTKGAFQTITLNATIQKLRVYAIEGDKSRLLAESVGKMPADSKAFDQLIFAPTGNSAFAQNVQVEGRDKQGRLVLLSRTDVNSDRNADLTWTVADGFTLIATNGNILGNGNGNGYRTANLSRNAGNQKAAARELTISYGNNSVNSPQPQITVHIPLIVAQETKPLLDPIYAVTKSNEKVQDLTWFVKKDSSNADVYSALLLTTPTNYSANKTATIREAQTNASTLILDTSITGGGNTPNDLRLTHFGSATQGYGIGSPTDYFDLLLSDQALIRNFSYPLVLKDLAENVALSTVFALRTDGKVDSVKNSAPAQSELDQIIGAKVIAVGPGGEVYRATDSGLFINLIGTDGRNQPATGNTFILPNDASNLSNETTENVTITDIAAEGGYVYVLSKGGSKGGRVHVFTKTGDYSYSLTALDQSNLDNAVAISAVTTDAAGATGTVYVAYDKPNGDIGVLQFKRQ